ncbi:MAG: DUF3862 domain-containing protein [Planctomycetota bacterium]
MTRMILIVISIMFLGGCAHTFRKDFERLKIGMSQEEVRTALGEPWDTQKTEVSKESAKEYWVYSYTPFGDRDVLWGSAYGKRILLLFENGKLVKYGEGKKEGLNWIFIVTY